MPNLPKIPKLPYLTRKFVCRECCVGYDTNIQWDRHIQDRHEKKVPCKYRCGEQYPVRRSRNLKRHEETCFKRRKIVATADHVEFENLNTPPDFGIELDKDPDVVTDLPTYYTSASSFMPFGEPKTPEGASHLVSSSSSLPVSEYASISTSSESSSSNSIIPPSWATTEPLLAVPNLDCLLDEDLTSFLSVSVAPTLTCSPMVVPAPEISSSVSTPLDHVPSTPMESSPDFASPYSSTPVSSRSTSTVTSVCTSTSTVSASLPVLPRFSQVESRDYRLVKVKNIPLEVDKTHAISNYEYTMHDPRTYLRGAPSAYMNTPNSMIIKEQRIKALQLGVDAADISYTYQGTVVIKREKVLFANGDTYCLETTIVPKPTESMSRARETQTQHTNCKHCGRHPYI